MSEVKYCPERPANQICSKDRYEFYLDKYEMCIYKILALKALGEEVCLPIPKLVDVPEVSKPVEKVNPVPSVSVKPPPAKVTKQVKKAEPKAVPPKSVKKVFGNLRKK